MQPEKLAASAVRAVTNVKIADLDVVKQKIAEAVAYARADEREATVHELLHDGEWDLSCSRCQLEMQDNDMENEQL
jgi:hypothetical protein